MAQTTWTVPGKGATVGALLGFVRSSHGADATLRNAAIQSIVELAKRTSLTAQTNLALDYHGLFEPRDLERVAAAEVLI